MKANIPLMIQDPSTIIGGKDIVEGFIPEEDFFLSGPVTDRIAVLNFDENGGIKVSAFFKAPSPRRKLGRYMDAPKRGKNIRKSKNIYSDAFRSVAAFSMVLKTLYLFEGTDEKKIDTLGRKLTWAFDSPQLFVIPDAGEWANAFYCRDSNSLHFFHFYPSTDPNRKIYTGLSRDIVSHETGHAVVDGIASDLFDSCSPESLAIHEAMADLTAMLVAFQSNELREDVLKETEGRLDKPSRFSSIAEEFGKELYGARGCLRALHEFTSMNPDHEAYVGSLEPHDLSRVLSNALYDVMLKIFQQVWDEEAQKPKYQKYENPRFSSSGISLWTAAARFKRMVFRGLDVLPPGDISFADYGRAVMAHDTVAYDTSDYRDWIRDEFLRRSIVKNKDALKTDTHLDRSVGNEVWEIYENDYTAYRFAERERELLYIPKNVRFEVRPRHLVNKKYENDVEKTECIFKIAWSHVEENPVGFGLPPQRMIIVGTTLVFDMETGNVLLRLSNAPPPKGDTMIYAGRISHIEYEEQWDQRNSFIEKLVEKDVIKFGRDAYGPDGKTPLLSAVRAEGLRGVMRVRGTGKTLHILLETD
ncbi:MAG: hypothetical protein NWF14_05225 [Candidatus Bathyarchaeota archaeon]|nr:hypothetical protein [Candidatus Bathyarchaeota archaeon]